MTQNQIATYAHAVHADPEATKPLTLRCRAANLWRQLTGPRIIPIESSALLGASYDPRRHALRVIFRNGREYEYGCASRSLLHALVSAESPGRFFQAEIRDRYPYLRIDVRGQRHARHRRVVV